MLNVECSMLNGLRSAASSGSIQHSTFNTEPSTFAFRWRSRMPRMSAFQARPTPATVHGRYLVRDGPPERLLVGFHGYGETAEAHMRELAQIPRIERWAAVAAHAPP